MGVQRTMLKMLSPKFEMKFGSGSTADKFKVGRAKIKPKTRVTWIDALKEMIKAYGMNQERILVREALDQSGTACV